MWNLSQRREVDEAREAVITEYIAVDENFDLDMFEELAGELNNDLKNKLSQKSLTLLIIKFSPNKI